jgi:hypothetical protein
MMLEARPIIKNKFWIVEEEGKKVATIQAAPDGVVLVQGAAREKFVNFKLLSSKYNIKPGKAVKTTKPATKGYNIYDFPTDCKPFNELYDVRRKLPFYTKTAKSKSFFCAGYYAININGQWQDHFCPKTITVNRYEYYGPYKNEADMYTKIVELNS